MFRLIIEDIPRMHPKNFSVAISREISKIHLETFGENVRKIPSFFFKTIRKCLPEEFSGV